MSDNRQSLSDLGNMDADAPVNTAHTGGGGPPAPLREQEIDAQGRAYATGKRKNAIARVWLKPGTGKITVNSTWPNAATSMTWSAPWLVVACRARPAP